MRLQNDMAVLHKNIFTQTSYRQNLTYKLQLLNSGLEIELV